MPRQRPAASGPETILSLRNYSRRAELRNNGGWLDPATEQCFWKL